jgi:hypothetical protein
MRVDDDVIVIYFPVESVFKVIVDRTYASGSSGYRELMVDPVDHRAWVLR